MNKNEIIEEIRKVSNGTFIGKFGFTTLLGWTPKYDEQGRPLNCDPNYIDSSFKIDNKIYYVTKVGWKVYIWNKFKRYTNVWKKNNEEDILALIDLTPDYVKEYYKEIKNENT